MAFESDDDERLGKRRQGKAAAGSKSDPSELGKLDAEMLPGQRRSSMPPGSDADDSIDPATLAALSKAPAARPALPPPAHSSSFGWLIGLAIGFAAGVPAGAVLFPRTTVVSVPASPKSVDREAQLAAAEARARAADEVAAVVRPLPVQRLQQPAAEAPQPSAAEGEGTAAAEAPPSATPPSGTGTPAAASQPTAAGPGKNTPAPSAQSREAARAATAALNAGAVKPADANPSVAALPAPPPSAAPAAAAAQAGPVGPDGRSVDELLDQALASSTAKKERERIDQQNQALAAANTIPLSPSRDDVTRAMTVLLPAIRGCAAGQSGLATVGIIVKNDGHVESVAVTGSPFEGERSGRCMEGVVRHAKFPRFQQSSFRIQFPFAIQ